MANANRSAQALLRGRDCRAFLLAAIRQANTEILLATHTLEFDAFGQAVLAELEYACVRGVVVRWLIDPQGSRAFIADHPALLTSLETAFRLQQNPQAPGMCIVFDRQLAVTGSHAISEAGMGHRALSRIITGAAAEGLAGGIQAAWTAASAL